MIELPVAALLLAGFVLAHAAWNVSDLSEAELLAPLAVIEQNGQRELQRFEAPTQEEAINHGKAAMAKLTGQADAWAFAREGLFRESHGPQDVLAIDFWAKGMNRPATLIQRFDRYTKSGRFRLVGPICVTIDGKALDSAAASAALIQLQAGVQQHPKVAHLWATWR